MVNIDMRKAITRCTCNRIPRYLWYAVIDGKFYKSTATGKVFFTRRCDLVQSLNLSEIYYRVRDTAQDYIEFQESDGHQFTQEEKVSTIKKFWRDFLGEGDSLKARCRIKKLPILPIYY